MPATVTLKDGGAVGDDVADDLAAIQATLLANPGQTIRATPGRYRLVSAAPLVFPAGMTLAGDNPETTVFRFESPAAAYRQLMRFSNAGVVVAGIGFEVTMPAGGQAALTNYAASRIRMQHCRIDGGMAYAGGAWNHVLYAAQFPASGTQEDIEWDDCDFVACSYTPLKANTDTSTQRRLSLTRSRLKSFYGWQLNSPGGVCDDVTVDRCTIESDLAAAGLEQCILFGGASTTNLKVTRNHFKGRAAIAVHVEENATPALVADNTFEMDEVVDAIRVLDNAVGGSRRAPSRVEVCGNVIRKLGARAAGAGINIALDSSGMSGATRISIDDNIVDNFTFGIAADVRYDDGFSATGNLLDTCGKGASLTYPVPSYAGNHHRGCDVGVECLRSGLLGSNVYEACASIFSAPAQAWSASGWEIVLPTQSHAGGGAIETKPLIDPGPGGRYGGALTFACASGGGANVSHRRFAPVVFDGATFTATPAAGHLETGAIAADLRRPSSGTALCVGVFKAGAALADLSVMARFDGVWNVAP